MLYNDDFRSAAPRLKSSYLYVFDWHNFAVVTLTQSLPMLIGMILVAYAFKFTAMAGMNQGCIVCLFSVTSIYIAILFNFMFKESISWCKIAGIFVMIGCIVTLSLTPQADVTASEDAVVSSQDQQKYRYYAVAVAISAPFFWTTQSYFLRRSAERGDFNLFDMAIDQTLFINFIALLIYISYAFSVEEVDWKAFGFGQLVGVLFFAGALLSFLAFKTGPGGPVNTLIST